MLFKLFLAYHDYNKKHARVRLGIENINAYFRIQVFRDVSLVGVGWGSEVFKPANQLQKNAVEASNFAAFLIESDWKTEASLYFYSYNEMVSCDTLYKSFFFFTFQHIYNNFNSIIEILSKI